MRTTSSIESLNSVLGRSFPQHPHIFKFIDHLKLHEFSKYCALLELLKPNIPPEQLNRKRKIDQEREEKIVFFTKKLKTNEILPSEFLDAMAIKDILPQNGMIITIQLLKLKRPKLIILN